MEKRFRILLIILLAISLVLAVLLVIPTVFNQDLVRVNHIVPNISRLSSPAMPVSQTFSFENSTVTISTTINSSVYRGAKNTDKLIYTHPGVPVATWEGASARAMIQDPAQDEFYDDLLGSFRAIRSEQNLTDDEYAELLTAYVQSLKYRASNDSAKYPIETVYDGEGDCDDTSYLLAGLLSREGYRVALFLFEHKNHMVVGIGSDDNLYYGTGYAFVDIMDYSFIGVPVNRLNGAKDTYLDPIVIPIGTGTKIYHSGGETRYISDMATLTYQRSGNLALRMKNIPQDTPENISEYNRIVSDFNADSRVYTYIIRHRFDRPGVFAYLKREMPA